MVRFKGSGLLKNTALHQWIHFQDFSVRVRRCQAFLTGAKTGCLCVGFPSFHLRLVFIASLLNVRRTGLLPGIVWPT